MHELFQVAKKKSAGAGSTLNSYFGPKFLQARQDRIYVIRTTIQSLGANPIPYPAVHRFTLVRRTVFLFSLLLVVLFAFGLPWGRIVKGQNDFLQFYAGAKLVGTGHLHSTEHMKEVQLKEAQIWLPSVAYIRPDFYAVVLKPLALLPFPVAYTLFQALNLSALIAFLWLFRDRQALRWLAPLAIPLLVCFANGQDVELLLLLLGGAYLFEKKDRPIAAGLCLALCAIKAHFMIFTPLALLFWHRWRMFWSACVGILLLTLAAMPMEGWDWWLRYPRGISSDSYYSSDILINARGLALAVGWNERWQMLIVTAMAGILIVIALWLSRKKDFATGFCLAVLGGVLCSYHMGIQDASLFLILIAIAPPNSPMELGGKILIAPLTYYCLLADGILAALPSLILLSILGFHLYSLRYLNGGSEFPDSERSIPAGGISG